MILFLSVKTATIGKNINNTGDAKLEQQCVCAQDETEQTSYLLSLQGSVSVFVYALGILLCMLTVVPGCVAGRNRLVITLSHL